MLLLACCSLLVSGCSDDDNNFSNPSSDISLTSLAVTPAATSSNQPTQFTATATFSDGQVLNFSSQVAWASSNPAVATVSTTGLVTPLTAGSTSITASYSGISGSTTFTSTATSGLYTPVLSGTNNDLFGIAYASGINTDVAVGAAGTITTKHSADTVFHVKTSGTTSALHAVDYGNGVFVTVGAGGTILTSTDGDAWTARTSGVTDTINTVAFLNGGFIAGDDNGQILRSTNGTTWTLGTVLPHAIHSFAFGTSQYVAVGAAGMYEVSTDATTWTAVTTSTTASLNDVVTYFNNTFIAVGNNGTTGGTSAGGTTWASAAPITTANLNAIVNFQGLVAVGGDGGVALYTDSNAPFQLVDSGTTVNIEGGDVHGNLIYAVGTGGTILVYDTTTGQQQANRVQP